jgi:uncharacterized protein (PEP-CTERM system associated)
MARRPQPHRALNRKHLLGVALAACFPTLVSAQSWRIEPSIATTVTATSNSGLSFSQDKNSDLITDVEPRLVLEGKGASFTLNGNLAAHALVYANSSQANRLLPSGTLALNANLVERWIYFDASAVLEQIAADPYTVRADTESSLNKISSVQYRFSPYLQHSFTPSLALSMRSDNVWTRRRGEFADTDPRRNSVNEKQIFLLEQKPLPFGYSFEASQDKTSYVTGVETVLQIGSARAVGTYALDPTFTVGLTAGSEKSEYALSSSRDKIVGGRFTWAPTERSELRGSYESRFFGAGGSLQWSHRSPFLGIYLDASRQPSASGASFLLNPNGGDVQTLLDAIFTTRYPNPAERAIIVKNVISGLGVPSVLGQPVEVFADYAQLRDAVNASVAFQGVRSTLITRVYAVRSRQLNVSGTPYVPTLGIASDNYQKGMSIDFNRRLTSTLTADLGFAYAALDGLGIAEGQSTRSTAIRLGLTQALSPKTKVTVGTRYLKSELVAPGQDASAAELAAFAGMVHRF